MTQSPGSSIDLALGEVTEEELQDIMDDELEEPEEPEPPTCFAISDIAEPEDAGDVTNLAASGVCTQPNVNPSTDADSPNASASNVHASSSKTSASSVASTSYNVNPLNGSTSLHANVSSHHCCRSSKDLRNRRRDGVMGRNSFHRREEEEEDCGPSDVILEAGSSSEANFQPLLLSSDEAIGLVDLESGDSKTSTVVQPSRSARVALWIQSTGSNKFRRQTKPSNRLRKRALRKGETLNKTYKLILQDLDLFKRARRTLKRTMLYHQSCDVKDPNKVRTNKLSLKLINYKIDCLVSEAKKLSATKQAVAMLIRGRKFTSVVESASEGLREAESVLRSSSYSFRNGLEKYISSIEVRSRRRGANESGSTSHFVAAAYGTMSWSSRYSHLAWNNELLREEYRRLKKGNDDMLGVDIPHTYTSSEEKMQFLKKSMHSLRKAMYKHQQQMASLEFNGTYKNILEDLHQDITESTHSKLRKPQGNTNRISTCPKYTLPAIELGSIKEHTEEEDFQHSPPRNNVSATPSSSFLRRMMRSLRNRFKFRRPSIHPTCDQTSPAVSTAVERSSTVVPSAGGRSSTDDPRVIERPSTVAHSAIQRSSVFGPVRVDRSSAAVPSDVQRSSVVPFVVDDEEGDVEEVLDEDLEREDPLEPKSFGDVKEDRITERHRVLRGIMGSSWVAVQCRSSPET